MGGEALSGSGGTVTRRLVQAKPESHGAVPYAWLICSLKNPDVPGASTGMLKMPIPSRRVGSLASATVAGGSSSHGGGCENRRRYTTTTRKTVDRDIENNHRKAQPEAAAPPGPSGPGPGLRLVPAPGPSPQDDSEGGLRLGRLPVTRSRTCPGRVPRRRACAAAERRGH